ncbi:hypothetical protein J6590_078960 [Homalodisca vitripennis]|nr:hypothetical protein J6590_078960 [Homalodisca vitripennis]
MYALTPIADVAASPSSMVGIRIKTGNQVPCGKGSELNNPQLAVVLAAANRILMLPSPVCK